MRPSLLRLARRPPMSDQTLDPRLDSLLRDVLKAEAGSLPLTVRPEQILERRKARQGGRPGWRVGVARLSMAVGAGAAAIVIVVGAFGVNFFVNRETGIGAASPSPVATGSPQP